MADPEIRPLILDRLPKGAIIESGPWQILILKGKPIIRVNGEEFESFDDLDLAVDRFLEIMGETPGSLIPRSA